MLRYLLELSSKNTVFAIEPHIGARLAKTVNLMLDRQIPISGDAFGMDKLKAKTYRVSGGSQGIKTEKNVKVISIHGVMTMHGGMCSYGMIEYGEIIQAADRDPSVDAIVLDVNTPGGEAMYTETLAQIVDGTKKPVVTWVNQLTASAGYHFAAASNEIILSGKTAEIGSIGTLIHYLDFTRKLKTEGIDEVMILASRSTKKRKYNFSQPDDKDKNLIIEDFLDPHNEAFIEDVKSFRPGMPEEVFTGELYMGKNAIAVGLADQIGSLEFAISRAAELSDNSNPNSQSMNNQQVENQTLIQAISAGVSNALISVGLKQKATVTPVEQTEDQPDPTAESDTVDPSARIAQLEKENADLKQTLKDQETTISQQNEEFKALQAEVEKLGNAVKGATIPAQSTEVTASISQTGANEYVFDQTREAIKMYERFESKQ